MSNEFETIKILQAKIVALQQKIALLEQTNHDLIHNNIVLEQQISMFSQHQIIDPITGNFNQHYLHELIEREISRSSRRLQTTGVIMIGIDYPNDLAGILPNNDINNTIICAFSTFLQTHVRREDTISRYGEREFIIILVEVPLEVAHKRAEELCNGMRAIEVPYPDVILKNWKISAGVACIPQHGTTAAVIIQAVEKAMLRARELNMCHVCVADVV